MHYLSIKIISKDKVHGYFVGLPWLFNLQIDLLCSILSAVVAVDNSCQDHNYDEGHTANHNENDGVNWETTVPVHK